MLFDFSKHKDKFTERLNDIKKYDFIIIGSGPAGSTLANELSNKKYKILIIEEGKYFSKNKIIRRKIYSKRLRIKKESLVVALGGASNTWGSGSSYFEKFEMRDPISQKYLWPLKYNDLLNYYKKVEKKYKLKFPKKTKSKEINGLLERHFATNKKKIIFSDFIDKEKIDILLNLKIKNISEKKEISKCEVLYNSKRIEIYGKKIILCCGCLETIRLLYNSYYNKMIKNINIKTLGRYFMNHPKTDIGNIRYIKPKIDVRKYIFSTQKSKHIGLSLSETLRKEKNLLNSYIRLVPYIKKNRKWTLLYFVHKIFQKFKILNTKEYLIKFFSEMKPIYSNKVLFNKKNKKIIVDYNFSKEEVLTAKILVNKIYLYFSSNFFKEKIININKKFLIKNSRDASHHMGGTIYHPEKAKSFVNKDLRIIGLKNIYICSSSVFPTSGSANPTATIIALSIRLATHLLKSK
jgi:hypothetical protein